ncbi:hypothetical protein [Laspinema palackyanum]|uniref:hypothetical protein n=1 Tax=Laspinema palackyanum TaxID=3231601 RepID=UPI00345D7ADA|nr:hypothetical protein [Laspinema sp. D2c]
MPHPPLMPSHFRVEWGEDKLGILGLFVATRNKQTAMEPGLLSRLENIVPTP